MIKSKIIEFEKFASSKLSPDQIVAMVERHCRGKTVTIEEIVSSYEKYILWWESKYENTEERYISKENKRMPFYMFVQNSRYTAVWEHSKSKLDKYLFENYDVYLLDKNIKILEERIIK